MIIGVFPRFHKGWKERFRCTVLYFVWMICIAYTFAIITGTIGWLASFFFVRYIYASIKVCLVVLLFPSQHMPAYGFPLIAWMIFCFVLREPLWCISFESVRMWSRVSLCKEEEAIHWSDHKLAMCLGGDNPSNLCSCACFPLSICCCVTGGLNDDCDAFWKSVFCNCPANSAAPTTADRLMVHVAFTFTFLFIGNLNRHQ